MHKNLVLKIIKKTILPFKLALWIGLACSFLALANEAEINPLVKEGGEKIEEIVTKIKDFEKRIKAEENNDASLVEIRLKIETALDGLLENTIIFRPRLHDISLRLKQLGKEPEEDQAAEPLSISEERERLNREKVRINELIGKAEEASIQANRLINNINDIRKNIFNRTLFRRFDINFKLLGETLRDFKDELNQLIWTISSWLRFTISFKSKSLAWAGSLMFIAALTLSLIGRRFRGKLSSDSEISYLGRLSLALWSTIFPTALLALFFAISYIILSDYGVLRPDISLMLIALFEVICMIFFVSRLAGAVLSPAFPKRRLVPVRTGSARLLVWLFSIVVFTSGVDFFFNELNDILKAPLSLTLVQNLFATIIIGILLILISLVKPFRDEEKNLRSWPKYVRYPLLVIGLATIIISLFGYIGFARFISQQVVISGAIIVTMYLGFLSAQAISAQGVFAKTFIGAWLQKTFNLEKKSIIRIGLIVQVIINLIVLLIGIPLILLRWGFQFGDIKFWAYRFATEVTIGNVSFSLLGILGGILAFFIGYFATRWFQRWFDGQFLARGEFDRGIRNSIRTAIGYLGIGLAILFGISAAGISLSSFALIAGALSLGIGFGLQNIVSNFVSGLILLAERPFKVGDWIVAGGTQGTVRKISVRATEIETFQRQTIILPNSDLINSAVGNWTHRNHLGRVEIKIGVAYDSNPNEVYDFLLKIAKKHPLILKNPEPSVIFRDFGASSLDFELRFFLADILNVMTVSTEIRFEIYRSFKEAGIEIPFPQRDLHIKSLPSADEDPLRTEKKPLAKSKQTHFKSKETADPDSE